MGSAMVQHLAPHLVTAPASGSESAQCLAQEMVTILALELAKAPHLAKVLELALLMAQRSAWAMARHRSDR